MRVPFAYILLLSLCLLGTHDALRAQSCTQATTNYLCAEGGSTPTGLEPVPYQFGCFDQPMSYVYSFHTGTDPNGQLFIDINPTDCDNFIGNDPVMVTVIQLPSGVDPCFPLGSPFMGTCQQATGPFTAFYANLATNADFLLVVGSPHDTIYGPCEMDVSIYGSAIDITATVEPLIISLGESAELEVVGGAPVAPNPQPAYQWSPSAWLDDAFTDTPTSTPEETVSYTATSQIGNCSVTDQITVTVGPPIVIFNAFTPNNDGTNDVWEIGGIQRFENVEVNVYDRWGQSVFRSIGYVQPWDGTYKGRKLPTGAYYYHIALNDLNVTIPPYTGVVSIVTQ